MKILFTVAALDGFHGSVIHVLEWARFLVEEGHSVTVITGTYTQDIVEIFNKQGIQVIHIHASIENKLWDCAISYHFPFITKLLNNGMRYRKVIVGCLSSFELLESPPCFWHKCNLIITMSLEAKEHLCNRYSIPDSKIIVIPNGIPSRFFKSYKEKVSLKIQRIAVVSNHIPDEIKALKSILEGVAEIRFIGMHGDICELVTPELLTQFDVVITIGKTVQYCLGLGIPVYEYDHFGGNGYVTSSNFHIEKKFNFSGRPHKRKLCTKQIFDEIFNQYNKVLDDRRELYNISCKEFCYEFELRRVISEIFTSETDIISSEVFDGLELQVDHDIAFANYYAHLQNIIRIYEKQTKENTFDREKYLNLKSENEHLQNAIVLLNNEKKSLFEELNRIHKKNERKVHRRIGRFIKNCKKVIVKKLEFFYSNKLFNKKTNRKIRKIERRGGVRCIMAVKNEEKYLPGFFKHIRDYVDGFIILDDGSTDSTYTLLKQESKMIEILHNPPHTVEEWSDKDNRLKLMSVAAKYTDVVLCCDADERFEIKFLENLRKYAIDVYTNKNKVIGLKFRELWGSNITYRVDGLWNEKRKFILFSISKDSTFSKTYFQKLHIPWWHDDINEFELLDYNLYHLKMIDSKSRAKRAELYEKLDPDHKLQSIGYEYLVNTDGLSLKNVDDHAYDILSAPE